VFLDIQMPEIDGRSRPPVGPEKMPATNFCHRGTTLRASRIEANAIDYLLKPVGQARFEKASRGFKGALRKAQNRMWLSGSSHIGADKAGETNI